MDAFAAWVGELYAQLGYGQIVLLMALESSVFPVPSELVMIPAGYLSRTGRLDPVLSVVAGTAGSLIGASANYLFARYAGRALLLRYGKYVLIDERKYHLAEAMFLRNAKLATFTGRLLPVVRHLISLPAGVFAMPASAFAALTALGAAVWCSVLVAAGYFFGEPAVRIVHAWSGELAIGVVVALAGFAGGFLWQARKA